MRDKYDTLIVGAGHAGAQLALALRQRRYGGTIGLVGEEAWLPYDRPPLSKDYLAGKRSYDEILLRSPAVWDAQQVDLLLGRRAEAVDATGGTIALDNGSRISYGTLVWAAGGRARRLACLGATLPGVHTIRARSDVDQLRAELGTARNVVIVGGGYIGLEAAATICKAGTAVTILEAQSRLMARVAGPELSEFFKCEHERHGVGVELGAVVEEIEGRSGRVAAVRLNDGRRFEADLVIVGVGITPNVEVLTKAGAITKDGVVVDTHCGTSLRAVYAIGDCALHPSRYSEHGMVRIESVQNATEQAATVARNIVGEAVAYDAVPWFWSQQFDVRLQTVGLSHGHDASVIRGSINERSFSVVYMRRGCVIALDCVNAGRDFNQGKLLVINRSMPDPIALASPGIELRSLVA